jgi:hypothetical protein
MTDAVYVLFKRAGDGAPSGAGGELEQPVVSARCLCRDRLHRQSGLRAIRGGRVVDRSLLLAVVAEESEPCAGC